MEIVEMEYYKLDTYTGVWETDKYPIGGCFKRYPKGTRVSIVRTFESYKGVNAEGFTDEGVKIAFYTPPSARIGEYAV